MTRMDHRSGFWVAAALTLLEVAGGCATAPATQGVAGPARSFTAADYYPLNLGWKWAYDLEKDGQKMLALYAVVERTADTATVQAGEDRLMYAVTAEGIAQKEGTLGGDFVIKNPVVLGGEWIVTGGKAKIVSVGQEVTIDAGKFGDCAVVEVTRSDPVRVARTTFAPGVGPIALELQVQVGDRFSTVTRATLRAVTKPGEDPLKN
jgi:hypothetical protein